MRLVIVLCSLLTAVLAATPASAVCPENQVWAGCYPDAIGIDTRNPTAKFGETGLESWTAGQACVTGCYDLPAGTLAAKGHVNPYGGCIAGAHTRDEYQVVGPAGPPLSFEAVFQVHAVMAPFTGYGASIQVGALEAHCHGEENCEAAIALSYAPGAPFLLEAVLQASGDGNPHPDGDVFVTGTIRFRGLPAGYSIVSCQNYDLPTPAQPATWGAMKALYR